MVGEKAIKSNTEDRIYTKPLLRNPRGVCDTIKAIYAEEDQEMQYFLPWE